MDETYRMLGREHEADLEREAANWRLADQARKPREKARSGLLQTLIRGHRAAHGRTFFVRSLRRSNAYSRPWASESRGRTTRGLTSEFPTKGG
jgi:hypothetical protein